MTSRAVKRIKSSGREFLERGLNVTDNPLLVDFDEMVDAENILVGATLARKKRGGQERFSTDASDENASYPLNPENNSGADGDPIRGLYEFWRYDSVSGDAKTTLMARSGAIIWAIDARTGVATNITGALSLQTTGIITFQTFENKVYWTSTNAAEGLHCWDGIAAAAVKIADVAAVFVGAITGVTGNVDLVADNGGTEGNSILLTGDGVKTLTTLVSDWNTANPTNTVTLNSANGGDTPANLEGMQLAGGLRKLPPDGEPGYIISHGGRMWAWGVIGFPYRAYASEFYDATSWAVTTFGSSGTPSEPTSLDLDPFGDPTGINGAASFQNKLYLFLSRSIFEVSGVDINDFVVKTISRQVGAVSHASIVPIANDIIYASERGILRLSSTDKAIETSYAFASRPISRIWNGLLDRTVQKEYVATYDERDNLYLLSVASSGSSIKDQILVYNVQNDMWTTWNNHKARSLTSYIINGINRVISGREDGRIVLMGTESRTDLGNPFTAKYKTGILFPGGEMDIEHLFQNISVLASTTGTGTLTVNIYVDSTLQQTYSMEVESGQDLLGSTFVLGQSKLGSGVFIPQTFRVGAKGYGIQIEIIFNTTSDVETYGFMAAVVGADHRISGGA